MLNKIKLMMRFLSSTKCSISTGSQNSVCITYKIKRNQQLGIVNYFKINLKKPFDMDLYQNRFYIY